MTSGSGVAGPSGTLLRDLSYFPEANIAVQVWALVGWVTFGVVLALLGHHRNESALTGRAETGAKNAAETESRTAVEA